MSMGHELILLLCIEIVSLGLSEENESVGCGYFTEGRIAPVRSVPDSLALVSFVRFSLVR